MNTNHIIKAIGNVVMFLIAIVLFLNIDKLTPNDPSDDNGQCEYRCNGKPDYQMCEYCTGSYSHGGKSKELYTQYNSAVCRAFYNINVEQYQQGYKIYQCPRSRYGGYHLTTSYRNGYSIETGIILDTNEVEITQNICGR